MKIFNAFFTGIIFVLAPIFTLFVGIYNNYFSFYGINEYFNVIFVDNVPFLWLLPVFFIFGYCFFYAPFRKIFRAFYLLLLVLCALSWYPDLGRSLGEAYFMSKPLEMDLSSNLQNDQKTSGKVLYDGRREIYFLRSDNDKVVKISK
ncbi:isoleucyl-tRNA synthetase [Campylobacter concisus]|uniref:isoleucyl-tRNA synthetase n=1 Tax=Campylobacter concisus TaxID=199 RepID=UPI00122C4A09|nr:isoleucyl-tRNA synthetase [Campylobacter concisus]